ncbi:FAS1 domain [Sesbania bispinosa]|nr:FAS1 domain [Sesbania bispinosa]
MKKQVISTSLVLFFLIPLVSSAASANGSHNITRILADHPGFSTFNHYLTVTHLADEINRRQTITVLALDNAAMSSLLDKHLTLGTLKNVLSLHVLVDYFGTKKLHQISNRTTLVSSMFQATGAAAGTAGYVNITNLRGGKVGFAAEDNDGLHSFYVKSVIEKPYVISVLQISQPLSSADAEAPTAAPSEIDIISIMSKQGCKAFADLLRGSKALPTFKENVAGGLTMLKSSNGIMNTLATEGANKYDFTVQNDGEDVKLETKVNTANIVGTLIDQDPFVAYKINKVLMPRELFKGYVEAPAESPKGAKSKKKKGAADAPADGPAGDEADDQKAADDNNGVSGLNNGRFRFVMVLLSLFVGVLVL